MKRVIWLAAAFVMALVLDGTSKSWAEQVLVPYEPIPLTGDFFRLTLGYNTGVAFGIFSNGGPWPLIITGIVIAGLMIWFWTALRQHQFPPLAGVAIGLLLGGAIGNFIDRLPDGRVTDFLDFGLGTARWPTFNLADSFILIGLGLLMLMELNVVSHRSPPPVSPPESPSLREEFETEYK